MVKLALFPGGGLFFLPLGIGAAVTYPLLLKHHGRPALLAPFLAPSIRIVDFPAPLAYSILHPFITSHFGAHQALSHIMGTKKPAFKRGKGYFFAVRLFAVCVNLVRLIRSHGGECFGKGGRKISKLYAIVHYIVQFTRIVNFYCTYISDSHSGQTYL